MGKKKILVVDDETAFIKMVRMRLEANNYEVIEAADGNEGLKKTREENPDLILLDIMMPHKDGYTMLHDLKMDEKTELIPVIIITAKANMKKLFEREDIEDYLTKPFDNVDLLQKIEKVLNKQKKGRSE